MPTTFLAQPARDRTAAQHRGGETILVVDDEQPIRELLAAILRRAGYRVLLAANGCEAVSIFEKQAGQIDLIITDVRMPGATGPYLLDHLLSIHPRLKCMLMSATACPDLDHAVPFLAKPFSLFQLLNTVAEAFDEL